jgi:hypothetical protein
MNNTNFFFFLLLLCFSCSSDIDGNTLDTWIRDNNHEKAFANIYKRQNMNKEKFRKVFTMYSDSINSKNLITRPYTDNSLRGIVTKRKRKGYEYYDTDNNLHYSITYKLLAVDKDSTLNFNFIDFRATDRNLPCVKIPTFAPVRCIYKTDEQTNPMYLPQAYYDSLEMIGPLELEGKEYFHYDLLKRQKRNIPMEERKNSIVINIGNNYVKKHIDIIMKDLDDLIGLDSFDLAYIEDISTPKLRIGFDAGFEPKSIMQLLTYFNESTQEKIMITPLYDKKFVPMKGDVIIGHAYDEKKKISFPSFRRNYRSTKKDERVE